MNKVMNAMMFSGIGAGVALTSYMLLNKKNKNMLDILIEEIETIK